MAEQFVSITEGDGDKKLHTFERTVNGQVVQDEVVVLGEHFLPTYWVGSGAAVGTANDHVLQLMAGASKKLRIRRVVIRQTASLASAITAAEFQLVRLTTAGTGGSAVTGPNPFDTSSPAAGAVGKVSPSPKGTEGAIIEDEFMTIVAALPTQPGIVWDYWDSPIVIPAGAANGIAIKSIGFAATGAGCTFKIYFDESEI